MKIFFAAGEVAPFAKVGGLADVAGSLPKALKELGADVTVLMPHYATIDNEKFAIEDTGETMTVAMGPGTQTLTLAKTTLPGSDVNVVLFGHENWIGNGGVYAETPTVDLDEKIEPNLPRFALFSVAAAHYIAKHATEPAIAHLHDWHTGLATALLKGPLASQNVTTLHTIHNLAYQGGYGIGAMRDVLGDELIKSLPATAILPGTGSDWFNFLLAAIHTSDWVSTVSPTYRNEILTEEHGAGLETHLQAREDRLIGILNGIDTERWNPEDDESLEVTYGPADAVEKKKESKKLLQKELGLPVDENAFMLGMVSRIAEQKGFDILDPGLPVILDEDKNIQFVMLGTGDPQYTADLKDVEERFPNNMVFKNTFSEDLAHRIYAASDAFYMPSRFEPCGLGQMFAMRYGNLPIARATGGLKDTVIDMETGFVFDTYNTHDLVDATRRAERTYREEPEQWAQMVQNAMAYDATWSASAKLYTQLYEQMLKS